MKWLCGGLLSAALVLGTEVAALEVLSPAAQADLAATAAWLVVRSGEAPRVTLDGVELAPRAEVDGVYHYRLEDLGAEAVALQVHGDGERRQLTLRGRVSGGARFHSGAAAPCWECHDQAASGCSECHLWEGRKHTPLLAQGCSRCHAGPEHTPVDIIEVCTQCHAEYASGKHGRLRHAVRSERDPLRPGRAMDCASCHDPHAPRCLSCLGRPELRTWCKRCHGGA